MKKLFILSILLFVIILIPACSKKDNPNMGGVQESPTQPRKELDDIGAENAITKINWFKVGNRWDNIMKSDENVTERTDKVIGTANVGDKNCYVIASTLLANSGNTVTERPLETNYYYITNDTLENNIKILGSGDGKIIYYPPQPVLKLPLKKGKTWKWEGSVNRIFNGTVTYTVNGMEEVDIPAGKFKAVSITALADFSGPDGRRHNSDTTFWLVKDIGLVKIETSNQLYQEKKQRSVSEMKNYKLETTKGKQK